MSTVAKEVVAALCKKYGPMLNLQDARIGLDPGSDLLDGAQLLWAIAGNESSFGANCGPRFEESYFDGVNSHSLVMKNLLAKYGRDAACSYGPWQLMAVNAQVPPALLDSDPDWACKGTIRYLNGYVLGHWQAKNLQQIGETFNGGHPGAKVPEYVERLRKHYIEDSI